MRLVMDACILFPTVLREILLGVAGTGAFQPLYSARILEEWRRAAARSGPETDTIARTEIALLRAAHPKGEVTPAPEDAANLSLPDPDDVHVLAAAIAGAASGILTANVRDFPTRSLARHGLILWTPDSLLLSLTAEGHDIAQVVTAIQARTETISDRPQPLRALLKRAGLPRLGKALTQT